MAIPIQIKSGTRAQIDEAAATNKLLAREPYLITDEGRIAVGLTDSTYEAFKKESESSGGGDEVDFTVTRTENNTGSQTLYNPARREYTLLDITNAATTYTITLSPKPNSGGSATITNVEHYVTVKNTAAAAKTLVVRLETAGQKLISEGLTAIPLAISGIYEIGFIWLTRGADTICVITKTTLLTEVTQS